MRREREGGSGGGEREIIYLSLHCRHQSASCIKMGSDESHFNVPERWGVGGGRRERGELREEEERRWGKRYGEGATGSGGGRERRELREEQEGGGEIWRRGERGSRGGTERERGGTERGRREERERGGKYMAGGGGEIRRG